MDANLLALADVRQVSWRYREFGPYLGQVNDDEQLALLSLAADKRAKFNPAFRTRPLMGARNSCRRRVSTGCCGSASICSAVRLRANSFWRAVSIFTRASSKVVRARR